MNIRIVAVIVGLFNFFPGLVFSDDSILPTPDYTGSLLNRSKLTGDWNGIRGKLAEKGLHVNFRSVSTYQNLAAGGIKTDDAFVSTQDLLLQFDTGKAELWPGGLLTLRVESREGRTINSRKTGGISPVNNDALYPNDSNNVNEETIGLTELVYAQFLSPQFGVFGGLLNTLDGDDNKLAGNSRSDSHFMNSAFLLSLVAVRSTPSVTLGGGLIFIPNDQITGSVVFYDTEESSTHNPFTTGRGNTAATEWNFKYSIGDLPGAQTFGFIYAFDNKFAQFGNDPRASLRGLITGNGIPRKSDTWAFYHSAHQYLQGTDSKGWGIFTRFGIADEDSNPIHWTTAVGISGNHIIKGRPNDSAGIGYYHLGLSDSPIFRFLDINDENGAELWYNAEITPWLHVTADMQIVDTALGTAGRGIIPPGFIAVNLPKSEVAYIFGLRAVVEF